MLIYESFAGHGENWRDLPHQGEIESLLRPHFELLDYRERRMLVLGTMMALGRWEEFTMHLRAALVGQLSIADIKEVFLQQAIYCGVPIANTAHHHLEAIMNELKEKGVNLVGDE